METDWKLVELSKIRLAVRALGATAHLAFGAALIWMNPREEYGPSVGGLLGTVFVLIGLVQKLVVFIEWLDVIQQTKKRKSSMGDARTP